MIGETKNNWTIIASAGANKNGSKLWHCLCKCGNKAIRTSSALNCMANKGCKICQQGNRDNEQQKLIGDLIGKTVGNWTIISFEGKNKYKSRLWKCRCKCGEERKFKTSYLSGGGKKQATCCKSCEIQEMELRNRLVNEMPDRFWQRLKDHAKRREIEFSLTREEAMEQFSKQNGLCALSGLPLHFTKLRTNYSRYTTASLDRIDSNKPYESNNIQWLEKRINMMKQQYEQKEFVELCKLVANN